ncbi:hypothetical protein ACOSQ4_014329 [Xanthoceras sorbifolium]
MLWLGMHTANHRPVSQKSKEAAASWLKAPLSGRLTWKEVGIRLMNLRRVEADCLRRGGSGRWRCGML